MKKLLLAIFLTLFVSQAQAALTFTIDTYTNDELSFTISGTFDADTTGTVNNTGWLAIKNDWSNNIGVHTEFMSVTPTVTSNTLTIGGVAVTSTSVQNDLFSYTDSVFFENPNGGSGNPITAGTAVSGSITLSGVGAFNPADATTLELVSGFLNAGTDDWNRLEAKAGQVIVPVVAPVPTLSQYTIFLLILSLMFVSFYLKRRNQY